MNCYDCKHCEHDDLIRYCELTCDDITPETMFEDCVNFEVKE